MFLNYHSSSVWDETSVSSPMWAKGFAGVSVVFAAGATADGVAPDA